MRDGGLGITVSTGFRVYGFLAEFLELVEGDGEAGGVGGDLGGYGTHDVAGAVVDYCRICVFQGNGKCSR